MTDTVARAFDLAKSGKYQQISELERVLAKEGHLDVYGHLNGHLIRKQLVALMKIAGPENPMPPVRFNKNL